MSATLNIYDIISKVKLLDKEEQFTLLERLIALLKKNESSDTSVKF